MRAHNRQGALHRDGLRAGIRVGSSVENGGLVEYFFGTDGKKCLRHESFVQFLRSLHDEVCSPQAPIPQREIEKMKKGKETKTWLTLEFPCLG